jgi:hypothetical protein
MARSFSRNSRGCLQRKGRSQMSASCQGADVLGVGIDVRCARHAAFASSNHAYRLGVSAFVILYCRAMLGYAAFRTIAT